MRQIIALMLLVTWVMLIGGGCCSSLVEGTRDGQAGATDTGQNDEHRDLGSEPGAVPGDMTAERPAGTEEPSNDEPAQEPADSGFVLVSQYIPTIHVELKYATDHNFTGKVIYEFSDAYLRYGTVRKLQTAQKELERLGYSLKIWDTFRPIQAQSKLWEAVPDPRYVGNPNTGFSSHSRGNTVDVTLVTIDGAEVEMPSGFDDFSPLGDRDYSDVSDAAAANARLLEETMV